MSKNQDIQVVRAIATIIILIGHMPFALPNILLHGYPFVGVFLVVSGYLSAKVYMHKWDEKENIGKCTIIKNEIVGRFFRLMPLMWIWILLYFVVGNLVVCWGGQYGDIFRWKKEIISALSLTYNYWLSAADIGGLFGQYWTFFVEIHFFCFFVIFFSLCKDNKKRVAVSWIIILLVIFLFRPLTPVKIIRYDTHTHLDFLFAGVLLGIYDNGQMPKFNINNKIKSIIAIVLCSVLYVSGYYFDVYHNNYNVKYVVFLILSVTITYLAVVNDGWYTSFPKIIVKILNFIGDCSASIYASHILIFSCLYYNFVIEPDILPEFVKYNSIGTVLQVVFLITIAVLVGRVSYVFIEKPYAEYGKKFIKK